MFIECVRAREYKLRFPVEVDLGLEKYGGLFQPMFPNVIVTASSFTFLRSMKGAFCKCAFQFVVCFSSLAAVKADGEMAVAQGPLGASLYFY
uniref:Uncharacterized protein n=1 Tax=Aegilops tauschii subsp. strangulata TaxID=200361 RepID=A0A453PYS9_AEGTS